MTDSEKINQLFHQVKMTTTGATAIMAEKLEVSAVKARLNTFQLAMGGYRIDAQKLLDQYQNKVVTAKRYVEEFRHQISVLEAQIQAILVDSDVDHNTVVRTFEEKILKILEIKKYLEHAQKIVDESNKYQFGNTDVKLTDLEVGWSYAQRGLDINEINEQYHQKLYVMEQFATYISVYLAAPADEEVDKK